METSAKAGGSVPVKSRASLGFRPSNLGSFKGGRGEGGSRRLIPTHAPPAARNFARQSRLRTEVLRHAFHLDRIAPIIHTISPKYLHLFSNFSRKSLTAQYKNKRVCPVKSTRRSPAAH
ncbi:hypothetical protein ACJJTC_000561 [Scirpophaga incertulas]